MQFGKLLERIIYNRVYNFFDKEGLFTDSQFGFRNGLSTIGAVTILHELITENLDKKKKVYAAFIDLKKAFETFDHESF